MLDSINLGKKYIPEQKDRKDTPLIEQTGDIVFETEWSGAYEPPGNQRDLD